MIRSISDKFFFLLNETYLFFFIKLIFYYSKIYYGYIESKFIHFIFTKYFNVNPEMIAKEMIYIRKL